MEPADLVWASNDVIILMGLYRGARPTPWALKHNLDDLGGWMKAWRRGQRLLGHNSYQSFDLGEEDFEHVVLLSVVDGPGALTAMHHDKARQFNVSVVASIPHELLDWIASHRASARDLIELLRFIDRHTPTSPELLREAERRELKARAEAGIHVHLRDAPETLDHITQHFVGLRHAKATSSGGKYFADLQQRFADLSWSDLYAIIGTITGIVAGIEAVPSGAWGPARGLAILTLPPYVVAIFVARSGSDDFPELSELLARSNAIAAPIYSVLVITILITPAGPVFSYGIDPEESAPRSASCRIVAGLRRRRDNVAV